MSGDAKEIVYESENHQLIVQVLVLVDVESVTTYTDVKDLW